MTDANRQDGWLIERHVNSQLLYWSGRKTGDESFCQDVFEAVRFAREEDASRVLAWCLNGQGRVAEHRFGIGYHYEMPNAVLDAMEEEDKVRGGVNAGSM